jgi:NADH-quinone oxidoreductase subunit M
VEKHLLSILIFLPLIGAAMIFFFTKNDESGASNARMAALWTTLVTFAGSIILWHRFDNTTHHFQFVEKMPWFEGLGISYHLGVDGISLFMIVLTAFLMPICILCSWESITKRVREYMMAFLLLETFVIGVFCALDLMLFYLFFEGMLIPMYLIIGIWGGDRRVYAAYKFFLYTLAGSILFLVAMIYLYIQFGTTDIPILMQRAPELPLSVQQWLWLAMLASFAVKVPMWPVHTWLPDAHVQAPTAGSVILAGILLKMGAYGFLRFSLPMLPGASEHFANLIFVLSCIAVIYTSLVALIQEDMKKLIAYSSVAHMGFVTLGIFTFNPQGIEGAIFQMISHGLVSGALFLCVGVVYDRLHTREITRYGGLVNNMPIYAVVFMIFTMASVGLPGTSGFVGEILVLIGGFQANQWAALFAATGLVLGAAYMLWLYRRVCFGELTKSDLKKMKDLSAREKLIFVPIIVAVLWLGIYPKPILEALHPSVEHLIMQVKNRDQIDGPSTAETIPEAAEDLDEAAPAAGPVDDSDAPAAEELDENPEGDDAEEDDSEAETPAEESEAP